MAPPLLPDGRQHRLELGPKDELDAVLEARIAERADALAFRWRLRTILIETLVMAAAVAILGIALGRPASIVALSAVLVGGSCFAGGLLMMTMSGIVERGFVRLRAWWRSRRSSPPAAPSPRPLVGALLLSLVANLLAACGSAVPAPLRIVLLLICGVVTVVLIAGVTVGAAPPSPREQRDEP